MAAAGYRRPARPSFVAAESPPAARVAPLRAGGAAHAGPDRQRQTRFRARMIADREISPELLTEAVTERFWIKNAQVIAFLTICDGKSRCI